MSLFESWVAAAARVYQRSCAGANPPQVVLDKLTKHHQLCPTNCSRARTYTQTLSRCKTQGNSHEEKLLNYKKIS